MGFTHQVKRVIDFYNQIMLRTPALTLILPAILFGGLSLALSVRAELSPVPEVIKYAIYAIAAITLALASWKCVLILKDPEFKKKIILIIHKRELTARLMDDYGYRTIMIAYVSFFVNISFAVYKGITGWLSFSAWLITLAVYYLILCFIRMWMIQTSMRAGKTSDKGSRLRKEWKAYRFCGAMLIVLTIVLQGMVVLIMRKRSSFRYHGVLIFVVAMYDFYCLIASIVYQVRNRKKHTPVIVAIKNISFATALVSMLSLQTAMFASFGQSTGKNMQDTMNLITGTAVCLMLLGTGVLMIRKSSKELRKL